MKVPVVMMSIQAGTLCIGWVMQTPSKYMFQGKFKRSYGERTNNIYATRSLVKAYIGLMIISSYVFTFQKHFHFVLSLFEFSIFDFSVSEFLLCAKFLLCNAKFNDVTMLF